MIALSPEQDLPALLAPLRARAAAEGYNHIERLCADWASGANRFSRPGERFLLARSPDGDVIACGGLNIDPFEPGGRTGRLRRVYVAPSARGKGLGRRLIAALLADHPFDRITVRAGPADAGRFYEALGFEAVSHPTRTHVRATRR